MIDCIKNFTGVTRTTCECAGNDMPEGFDPNASEVGYYLNDVVPLNVMEFIECGDASMWHRLYDTRERAVLNFASDLSAMLSESHKAAETWSGNLGELITRDQTTSSTLRGLRVYARGKKGAYLEVSTIRVYSTTIGAKTITIKSSDGIYNVTQTVTLEAGHINKWHVVELDNTLKLPLWNDSNEELYYFIYWNNTDAGNNKRKCPTCTGKLPYDTYMTVDGINGSDGTTWTTSEYQWGLIPEVKIICGFDYAVCESSEMAKLHLGIAFAHRWAIDLIDDIMRNPIPTKWTILGDEDLGLLRGSAEHTLRDNLQRAITMMNFGYCYTCSPRIYRSSILR